MLDKARLASSRAMFYLEAARCFFVDVFLCENPMVYINMLIREYGDCLRLLDWLEALGNFRAMRGPAYIDKPLGLCCNPAHEYYR